MRLLRRSLEPPEQPLADLDAVHHRHPLERGGEPQHVVVGGIHCAGPARLHRLQVFGEVLEHDELGRLVEARDTLRRVLRIPVESNEPKVFREARAQATALDDEVAVRIPTVRVVLTGADPGARVAVSDESEDVAWFPVDDLPPGTPPDFPQRLATVLAEVRHRRRAPATVARKSTDPAR